MAPSSTSGPYATQVAAKCFTCPYIVYRYNTFSIRNRFKEDLARPLPQAKSSGPEVRTEHREGEQATHRLLPSSQSKEKPLKILNIEAIEHIKYIGKYLKIKLFLECHEYSEYSIVFLEISRCVFMGLRSQLPRGLRQAEHEHGKQGL